MWPGSRSLHRRSLETLESWESIAEDWGRLTTDGAGGVFMSLPFARAWWRAYAPGSLKTIVISDSERVRLIAPLFAPRDDPSSWRVIGHHRGDYTTIIHEAGDERALSAFLAALRARQGWRRVALPRVPMMSGLLQRTVPPGAGLHVKLGTALAARGLLLTRSDPAPVHCISSSKLVEHADLLQRKKYRQRTRHLSRGGALRYQRFHTSREIQDRLAQFMDLHLGQFGARGPSLFEEARHRRFYELLVEELAPGGAVRLDWLTLDDRVIAAHFGFDWSDTLYYYKPCYDLEFADQSPGKLLLAHILRDAHERGTHEVDLLKGDEPYKRRYASGHRTTCAVEIRRLTHLAITRVSSAVRRRWGGAQ